MPARGYSTNRQTAVNRGTAVGRLNSSGRLYVSGGGGGGGADMIVTASLPAPGAADTTSIYRLSVDNKLYYTDGVTWFSQGIGPPTTKVDLSAFAWINQGGTTVGYCNGGAVMTIPANGSRNFRIQKKAIPAVPYTITAEFRVAVFPGTANASACLGFRQASDGKLASINVDRATVVVQKNVDATTFSGNYINPGIVSEYSITHIWMQESDNNTSRICRLSNDGVNFSVIHTVGRTDFLTADEVWWGGDAESASDGMLVELVSWVET